MPFGSPAYLGFKKKKKKGEKRVCTCMCVCFRGGFGAGGMGGGEGWEEGWEEGRECDGTTALCFLCRSLLFFRARKMGLCNSHVISPEIVVGLQLLPLLLPAAPLLGFWQQPDRHTALRSPLAPGKKRRNKTAAARSDDDADTNARKGGQREERKKKHKTRQSAAACQPAGRLSRTIKLFDKKHTHTCRIM